MEAIRTHAERSGQIELKLQKFMRLLHQTPNGQHVKVNPQTDQSKYLPISFMEMKLDEYFFGLWETMNFDYELHGNVLTGRLNLKVFHPIGKMWITRVGVSSTKLETDPVKQSAQLEKALPHMKAECIKNAARSLGKIFGRDLNRDFEDSYRPLLKEA